MSDNHTTSRAALPSRWRPLWPTLRDRLVRPGSHWVWLSMAMYALACYLPAIPPIGGSEPIRGYVLLIAVYDPIVKLYLFPAWWANAAYFVALIFYACGRHRIAAVMAVIAAALAVSFEVMVILGPRGVSELADLKSGCHVWIASTQVLACNLLWEQWLVWKRRQEMSEHGQPESA